MVITIKKNICETQSDFGKGRCTQDYLFTLRQIVEKARFKKRRLF